MNIAILKGNVGQDPKITTFENGGKVAQFSLATTERGYKTKDGKEIPDRTTWHNIVTLSSGLTGVVEQYVKKGSPLLVQGRIRTREYEKDGVKKFIVEIVANEVELLGTKEKEGSTESTPAPAPAEDLPF